MKRSEMSTGTPPVESKHLGTLHRLRRENTMLKAQVRDAAEELARLEETAAAAAGVDAAAMEPTPVDPKEPRGRGEACALAVLSDVHALETVRKREVNGRNAYNRRIARESVSNVFRGYLRWLQIHRAGQRIPTMVLAILGDIITNMLHADQHETNDGTPQQEILEALDMLAGGVDMLIEHAELEELRVVCADGNHGRDTDRMRRANRVRHSHEWLLYRLLRQRYADVPNVRFDIADGLHLVVPVFGRPVRFQHGDAVRYQGGVGGVTIPLNKAIAQWNKETPCELDVCGHWHTCFHYGSVIVNGSVIGYSPYSQYIKATYERPRQAFALLDKKRWLTSFHHVYAR